MAKRNSFYLIAITGGTDPSVECRKNNFDDMLAVAKKVYRKISPPEDQLFYAKVTPGGKLELGAFLDGEFDDAEKNDETLRFLEAAFKIYPEDKVQEALDELIYKHVGTSKSCSNINNNGYEYQLDALRKKAKMNDAEIMAALATELELAYKDMMNALRPVAALIKEDGT